MMVNIYIFLTVKILGDFVGQRQREVSSREEIGRGNRPRWKQVPGEQEDTGEKRHRKKA